MTEVLPAIIPESYEDLVYKMSLVKGIVKAVQVDICDGRFVPSKSWPYVGDDENHFDKIVHNEEEGFPLWENMDFEADLMVEMTRDIAENWIKAGAKAIILHIESSDDMLGIVKEIRKNHGYSDESVGIEIGIAINIDTPNEVLYEFFEPNTEDRTLADFVQFMGIKKIGYQGQEFDALVLDKISAFRKKYLNIKIAVDGGVNFDTYKYLIGAGANKLVSGSAIYESENIAEAIKLMQGA